MTTRTAIPTTPDDRDFAATRRSESGVVGWLRSRPLRLLCCAVFLFLVSLLTNLNYVSSTGFHPDESRWVNRAYYLREALHPFGATWEDRYLTRGQPPIGSYVMGLGLLAQGRDLQTNRPWDFNYGVETNITWNVLHGTMPSWDDLRAARRTSAFVGASTCVGLFLIVAMLTNAAGGLAAGLFMAINPLQIYLSSLGVSDATFTCLVVFSILATMRLARRPTWPRAIVAGLIFGAGAGTKLSPLLAACGLAVLGLLLASEPLLRQAPGIGRLVKGIPGASAPGTKRLGPMLISLPFIAAAVFVGSYPYLWPDPVGRTGSIFTFRADEMTSQAAIWPYRAIDGIGASFRHLWNTLEFQYSSSGKVANLFAGDRFSHRGIDVPLALGGLVLLLALAGRRGVGSPTFLAAAVIVGQGAVILIGLRIDFNRYYLPFVAFFAIGFGVLAGQAWAATARFLAWAAARPTVAARLPGRIAAVRPGRRQPVGD
ncbi:MAG: ArnT family glycosyltransferase [Thermomicrobiales bacterium]